MTGDLPSSIVRQRFESAIFSAATRTSRPTKDPGLSILTFSYCNRQDEIGALLRLLVREVDWFAHDSRAVDLRNKETACICEDIGGGAVPNALANEGERRTENDWIMRAAIETRMSLQAASLLVCLTRTDIIAKCYSEIDFCIYRVGSQDRTYLWGNKIKKRTKHEFKNVFFFYNHAVPSNSNVQIFFSRTRL